ncbi:permease [Aestuariibaculum sp. YM273]|uniref:permease n=1 Tax=Aestuariibaculum sp. YM273 TaxID=3070659 RepID=UPI0027DDEAF7|nr:permease [Aestuariibaculum sp. YM273]WMI65098.1 permease [Aestuariibaculum sp. YM273]
MSESITKIISFISFILIGVLLKRKFSNREELNGLKKIILLLALPATIFISLLKINLQANLILLPFLALGLNMLLFVITPTLLIFLDIKDKPQVNTAKLLLPSLAPGLSCFPFIFEFLGDSYLAKAAMADLGNKFFVLFILYIVAIKWYYRNHSDRQEPLKEKIKSLGKVMLFEPINILIVIALIFLIFGISFYDLPIFLQDNLNRLAAMLTPMVLLFIGLAIKVKRKSFIQIFSLLMLRYGVTLLLVGCIVSLVQFTVSDDVLFMLVFSLSACSFWPFAHISSITSKEIDLKDGQKTFDIDYALSLLALSLPLSVLLILAVFISEKTFTTPKNIFLLAFCIIAAGIIVPFYKWAKNGAQIKSKFSRIEKY